MLTYTSLLVACLVVSVIAYFLYRVVADSSKSIYRSRLPMALLDTAERHHKVHSPSTALAGNTKAFGQERGHATPKNFARTYPALPTESVDWGWQGSGVQLREPPLQPVTGQPRTGQPGGTGWGDSNHCSLYDVKTPQSALHPKPQTGRLHREEKVKPVGRTYKVTRKEDHVDSDNRNLNKPWGW